MLALQHAVYPPSPAGHALDGSKEGDSRLFALATLRSASAGVLRHVEALVPQLPGSSLSPWHLAALQRSQHCTQLFLQAAAAAPPPPSPSPPPPSLPPVSPGLDATAPPQDCLPLSIANVTVTGPEAVPGAHDGSWQISTDLGGSGSGSTGRGRPRRGSRPAKILLLVTSRAARGLGAVGLGLAKGSGKVVAGSVLGALAFCHHSARGAGATSAGVLLGVWAIVRGSALALRDAGSGTAYGLFVLLRCTFQGLATCFTRGIGQGSRDFGLGLTLGVGFIAGGLVSGLDSLMSGTAIGLKTVGSGTLAGIEGVGHATTHGLGVVFDSGVCGFGAVGTGLSHCLEILTAGAAEVGRSAGSTEGPIPALRVGSRHGHLGIVLRPREPPPPSSSILQDEGSLGAARDSPGTTNAAPLEDNLSLCVADAALAVLTLSPPASEQQCLAALGHVLQGGGGFPRLLRRTLHHLNHRLPASQPALAAAAASLGSLLSDPSSAPYPCPAEELDDEQALAVGWQLLNSYAASWLSLLNTEAMRPPPDSGGNANSTSNQQARATPWSPPSRPPLEMPFWDQGGGGASASTSRLPLPPTWLLMEAHELPSPGQSQPRQLQPGSAAGTALALTLGLQLSGSGYMLRVMPNRPATLRWAVHLAFLFDAGELLRSASAGGREGGAGAAAGACWQDPLARWSLAGLIEQLAFDGQAEVRQRSVCVYQRGQAENPLLPCDVWRSEKSLLLPLVFCRSPPGWPGAGPPWPSAWLSSTPPSPSATRWPAACWPGCSCPEAAAGLYSSPSLMLSSR